MTQTQKWRESCKMIPICICLIESTSYMNTIFNMFYPVGFLFSGAKTVEEIETVLNS